MTSLASSEEDANLASAVNVALDGEFANDDYFVDQAVESSVETEAMIDENPVVPEPEPKPTQLVTPKPIFIIPISDPNGFVDLAVSYLSAGNLVGNHVFAMNNTIDNNRRGAIKFAVKNIGTKASGEWVFSATLPSEEAPVLVKQTPLKPNEETIITLGFTPDRNIGTKITTVKVIALEDAHNNNNHFNRAVLVF